MKKTTIHEKTTQDWLAVLTAANARTPDVVPPGYGTIEQIAEETGKSITTIRKEIKAAIKAGVVEHQKFNVGTAQKTYPTSHYRIL